MRDAELKPYLRECPESVAVVVGSHINGLGIIRMLGECGIPVIALDYEHNMGQYSRYVTQRIVTDYRIDWEIFIRLLCRIGEQLQQRAVLYLTDERYCALAARHRTRLLPYYYLPFNPETILDDVNKAHQYKLCSENGIPCPQTFILEETADVDSLLQQRAELPYPLIVKPFDKSEYFDTETAFRLTEINGPDELQQIARFLHEDIGHGFIVSEAIPGETDQLWGLHAFCDEGSRVVAGYTRQKVSQRPYRYGTGTVLRAVPNPEVRQLAVRVLKVLQVSGACSVEFKYDIRDGLYKYIETNLRNPIWNRLARKSGLNLPLIHYYAMSGNTVELARQNMEQSERPGHFIIGLREWATAAEHRFQLSHLKRAWRCMFLPNRVWAVHDWGDLKPGLIYWGQLKVKAWQRIGRR